MKALLYCAPSRNSAAVTRDRFWRIGHYSHSFRGDAFTARMIHTFVWQKDPEVTWDLLDYSESCEGP